MGWCKRERLIVVGMLMCGVVLTAGCGFDPAGFLAGLWPWGDGPDDGVVASAVEDYVTLGNRQIASSGWDASDSPVTAYAQEVGSHMPTEDAFGEAIQRVFLMVDSAQRLTGAYSYDPDQNVVFIEGPHSVGALGAVVAGQGADGQQWQGTAQRTQDGLRISVETAISLNWSVDDPVSVEIQQTYTYTATEAIPANAGTGRAAIASGQTATWTASATFSAAISTSPYDELPDAEFRQRPEQHQIPASDPGSVLPDPNDYDPNFYDPNFYDPNDFDPNDFGFGASPLSGIWEVTDAGPGDEGWEDPNAPIAILLAEGNSFEGWGANEDGMREFLVFDANSTLVADATYDTGTNTVTVQTPGENPFLGVQFFVQEDGSYAATDLALYGGQMSESLAVAATVDVVARPDEDGDSWTGQLSMRVRISATADVPANPETGSPAVAAGDEAVYTIVRPNAFKRSSGPTILFPDAAWEIHQTGFSMAGTWETIDEGEPQCGWSDPESSLALFFEENGNPFESWASTGDEGIRDFTSFDANNTSTANMTYDVAENIVYVDTPASNQFVGVTLSLQGDGSLAVHDHLMGQADMGGIVNMEMRATIVVRPAQDGVNRSVEMQMAAYLTALQDLPANPGTGRPAIATGEKTSYTMQTMQTVAPAASPYLLFPDAEWQIRIGEEAASQTVPTGYVEVSGLQNRSWGWTDPESPIVKLMAEMDSLPEDPPEPFVPQGERQFLLFDQAGTVVLGFCHDVEGNVTTISADPEEDPMLANPPSLSPEGDAWMVAMTVGPFSDPGENLQMLMQFNIAIYHGDLENGGRTIGMTMSQTITMLKDWPENPETGRPAIPAGSTATWSQTEYYTATSSEGPLVLFPDAELKMEEPEEGGG